MTSEFVIHQAGDLPILLTAPHAGHPGNIPPGVPPRTGQGIDLFNPRWDTNTNNIIETVSNVLEEELGSWPYVVQAVFNRRYIDANRPPAQAYEVPEAAPHYEAYHQAVETYIAEINERWSQAILIDLHGQSFEPDLIWRGTQDGQSIARLTAREGADVLYQPRGLMAELAVRGCGIFPPTVDGEEGLYDGGYTVEHYSTQIDVLQLEIGFNYRRNQASWQQTSLDLAGAIAEFYRAFICVRAGSGLFADFSQVNPD